MKKLLTLILALAMLLSLAACGKTETPGNVSGSSSVGGDSSTPDSSEAPDPSKSTEEPPVTEPDLPVTPDYPKPHLTLEEFPKLDGSTSMAPMAEAVVRELLGVDEETAKSLVDFSRTTSAYYNLLWGEADLLIVAEANEEVEATRQELGFEWDKTPFATDAFVFVVNEANPVDSITVEEARRIYTGEITNWSQLGGEDVEIIPFQRNASAGSQALMEKLVMQGTPMMEAPSEYIVESMGGLMTAVKSYDNSPGAIGYSVYYYAEEMRMAEGLKLLKIDGVEPTSATIRSGAYSLTNAMYVVISSMEPESSNVRVVYNWILSEGGQYLAAQCGYVSIMDFETADRTVESVIEIGSRWYEETTSDLIPRNDYGVLLPYAGARLGDPMYDMSATGCLYGLMTQDGQVVVDAVYSNVYRPWYYDGELYLTHPLLILSKGGRIAVAAADGSWVTGYDYVNAISGPDGVTLVGEDSLTLMSPDGGIAAVLTREALEMDEEEFLITFTAHDGPSYCGIWANGLLALTWDVRCIEPATGSFVTMSMEDWTDLVYGGDGVAPTLDNMPDAYWFPDQLLGASAPGMFQVWNDGNGPRYYRVDGSAIPELNGRWDGVSLVGGLLEILDLNAASYYDLDTMECVFRAYLDYEAD